MDLFYAIFSSATLSKSAYTAKTNFDESSWPLFRSLIILLFKTYMLLLIQSKLMKSFLI
jgi:hypothetical protein